MMGTEGVPHPLSSSDRSGVPALLPKEEPDDVSGSDRGMDGLCESDEVVEGSSVRVDLEAHQES